VTTSYGAWSSPIRAADVADGVSLAFPQLVPVDGGAPEVWWTEGRPAESGRQVVVRRTADGMVHDVLPAPWNARTRVHEYGGLSWLVVGGTLVFCEFSDQRLWRLEPGGGEPFPLTPEPADPAALRYADLTVVGQELWCVRERHDGGSVRRHLVAVPLDGSQVVRELVGGSDFLAHPRVSPDGAHLAWLAWDHPQMPWDGTELRVAALGADGTVGTPRTLLGGTEESVLQPEWADPSTLYAVTDRSGWWNLVRLALDGGAPEPLHGGEEEFGAPLWQLGQTTYALLDDGRLAVTHGVGRAALGVLDPRDGTLVDLEVPFPSFQSSVRALDGLIVGIGISSTAPTAVVIVDPGTCTVDVLDLDDTDAPGVEWLCVPTDEALPGPDGRVVHALAPPTTHPSAVARRGRAAAVRGVRARRPHCSVGGVDEQGESILHQPRHRRAGRELCRLQRLRPGLPQLSARAVGRGGRAGLCRRRTGPGRRQKGGRGAPGHPRGQRRGLDRPIGTHPHRHLRRGDLLLRRG